MQLFARVQDGYTGFLFSPLDAGKLTAQMLVLARDEALRKSMGKNGHDWIHQNLISKKLAGQFDRILAGLITSQLQEVPA